MYMHKIEVYSDDNAYQPLGVITPTKKWADPSRAIRDFNGKQRIYYNQHWKTSDKQYAQYYTELVYKDGQHQNPVNIYYAKSGKLQSSAHWLSVWTDGWKLADKERLWYYESGSLLQKVPIKNGMWNGIKEEYWENGNVKLRQKYVDGKEKGCEEKFLKDGSCDISRYSSAFTYIDGEEKSYSDARCPCKSNQSSTNTTSSSSSGTVINKNKVSQYKKPQVSSLATGIIRHLPLDQKEVKLDIDLKPPLITNEFSTDDYHTFKQHFLKQMVLNPRISHTTESTEKNATLTINTKKFRFLIGGSDGHTCEIDYELQLKEYDNKQTLINEKKSSGTASSSIISFGVTKEKSLEKATQNLVKKMNSFLYDTYPVEYEVLRFAKDTKGNVASVEISLPSSLLSPSKKYAVYDSGDILQTESGVVMKEPIAQLKFDSKIGSKVTLSVTKSKDKKLLSEFSSEQVTVLSKQ